MFTTVNINAHFYKQYIRYYEHRQHFKKHHDFLCSQRWTILFTTVNVLPY